MISIDATELRTAAPRVADLYAVLLKTGRAVPAASTAGLPPGLAGRVAADLAGIGRELDRAASGLAGTSEDLLRRAGLADAADKLSTLAMGTDAPGMTAALLRHAYETGGYGVNSAAGTAAGAAKYGLGVFGLALGVGAPTIADLANPYLDEDRKVANSLACVTTAGGMLVAGGVIVGVMSGGLLPVALAAGAGIAFGVLDKELHITEGLADGIDWATDQTSAAADAVGDGAGDAVDAIGGLFG